MDLAGATYYQPRVSCFFQTHDLVQFRTVLRINSFRGSGSGSSTLAPTSAWDPGFGIEPGSGIEPGFGIRDRAGIRDRNGIGIRDRGWDSGSGIRDPGSGFGIRDREAGIRDRDRDVWDLGFGIESYVVFLLSVCDSVSTSVSCISCSFPRPFRLPFRALSAFRLYPFAYFPVFLLCSFPLSFGFLSRPFLLPLRTPFTFRLYPFAYFPSFLSRPFRVFPAFLSRPFRVFPALFSFFSAFVSHPFVSFPHSFRVPFSSARLF